MREQGVIFVSIRQKKNQKNKTKQLTFFKQVAKFSNAQALFIHFSQTEVIPV